jgi:hypothetical protein
MLAWLVALFLSSGSQAAAAASAGGTADPTVTCQLTDDPHARTFLLDRAPGEPDWRLSMQDRESGGRWIRLPLRRAAPVFAQDRVSLTYANANGGRRVQLTVAPGQSRLEVDVDYGLEVNIEPDLDPGVDRMNTNGPLTTLRCVVAPRR